MFAVSFCENGGSYPPSVDEQVLPLAEILHIESKNQAKNQEIRNEAISLQPFAEDQTCDDLNEQCKYKLRDIKRVKTGRAIPAELRQPVARVDRKDAVGDVSRPQKM